MESTLKNELYYIVCHPINSLFRLLQSLNLRTQYFRF